VDGGVLASLEYLKTSVFIFRDWTKDFGGTRFKGYTIAARDVNRRRLSASAGKKMVGPRQTL
jgi:hypothetical protein